MSFSHPTQNHGIGNHFHEFLKLCLFIHSSSVSTIVFFFTGHKVGIPVYSSAPWDTSLFQCTTIYTTQVLEFPVLLLVCYLGGAKNIGKTFKIHSVQTVAQAQDQSKDGSGKRQHYPL